MSLTAIRRALQKKASARKARLYSRFFKTNAGQYGEGDRFMGVTIPEIRQIVDQFQNLSTRTIQLLIKSPIHEERLTGLLILVKQYVKGDKATKREIYHFYLHQADCVNNWDLVDLTAHKIVGDYLLKQKNRSVLQRFARSKHLWRRRIAIVATWQFIRHDQFRETLQLSRLLLKDRHDLMHKAVGWMLREVGKCDSKVLEKFLKKHYHQIPRTTLRYAIERFPQKKRLAYLKGKGIHVR